MSATLSVTVTGNSSVTVITVTVTVITVTVTVITVTVTVVVVGAALSNNSTVTSH